MSVLLLFDIDGTLVDTDGAGLAALREGFFRAFPQYEKEPFPRLDLGGATDSGLAQLLFEHFDVAHSVENRTAFFSGYLDSLKQQLSAFRALGRGRVLPGVAALLEALADHPEQPLLGLLTGNAAVGARLKLEHFQIGHFFAFGAFGDDHHDRNKLGPIAVERATLFSGRKYLPERVVIIGDTVRDIACARAFGARVIAVATGQPDHEELERARPDLLIDDFSDLARAIALVESTFPANPVY